MADERNSDQPLVRGFRLGIDKLLLAVSQALSFFRSSSEGKGSQFREIFATTSDQVREKAEETRRAVKLRMAVLELEHHLNRLYPQIGKIACDLAEEGKRTILQDPELKERIEMAAEYRERLQELKAEQEAHHQEQRKREA